jgi:hypothetical protein
MSAIKDGRFPITLDKERHLLFSLNVLDEMQDRFGGYDQLPEALQGKDVIKNVKWLLTRLINEGAEDGEEPVTEDWIGKKIHAGNLTEFINIIYAAFNMGTLGKPDAPAAPGDEDETDNADGDEANPDDEKNSTGGQD